MNHALAVDRLIAAFTEPDKWKWSGRVYDGDTQCVCGERIKWLYIWKHTDGRELITGSTCVEYVPHLNSDELKRVQERAREIRLELQRIARAHASAIKEDQKRTRILEEQARALQNKQEADRSRRENALRQRVEERRRIESATNIFKALRDQPAHEATPNSAVSLLNAFLESSFAETHARYVVKAQYMRTALLNIKLHRLNIEPDRQLRLAAIAHMWIQEKTSE